MFEPLSSVYQVNQVTSGSLSSLFGRQTGTPDTRFGLRESPMKILSCPANLAKQKSLKRSFSSAFAKECDSDKLVRTEVNKQRKLDVFLTKDTEHNENESSCISNVDNISDTVENRSTWKLVRHDDTGGVDTSRKNPR